MTTDSPDLDPNGTDALLDALSSPAPDLRAAALEWMRRGEALRAHGGLYEMEAFAEAEEALRAVLAVPSSEAGREGLREALERAQTALDDAEGAIYGAKGNVATALRSAAEPTSGSVGAPALDAAWAEAEAARPDGWRPITVGPPDPDAYDVAGNPVTEPWCASTVSPAFFAGETDRDAEWACGYGDTPAAALRALAARLATPPTPASAEEERHG